MASGELVRSRRLIAAALPAVALAACAAAAAGGYLRDLRRIAAAYGFAPPAVSGKQVILSSSFTKMVFEGGTRKLYFNNALIWMHAALPETGRNRLLSEQDAGTVVGPLLDPDGAVGRVGYRTVVLDPGHGGRDHGTTGPRRTLEKKITLDIAKRAAEKIRAAQVPVRLTRSSDEYMSLSERWDRADRWGADVFVSIHANHADDESVAGLETFLMTAAGSAGTVGRRADPRSYRGNRNDAANMVLGYYVHKGMLGATRAADRGIKRARFEVLRDANCPAALVECGFVSNSREETMLMDPRYRDAVAEGISRGVITYLSRVRNARAALDSARQATTVQVPGDKP